MFLQDYMDAKDCNKKVDIVNKIMYIIHQACPVGAFVRHNNGRWWEVNEQTAREKVQKL
jgi:trehalose-6-phosphatase